MNILDARGEFNKRVVATYKEKITPMSFLRSFFKTNESTSKTVSIAVQRGTEKIAVDVMRGSHGQRNTFSKATEKVFLPPFYREYFDITEMDLYDVFQASGADPILYAEFAQSVAEKMGELVSKIERAYELQCSQVLHTGVVTLNNGDSIDFGRKSGSFVTPNDWGSTGDPFANVQAGCKWIRQNGKSQGANFNLILGETSLGEFMSNAKVLAQADLRRIDHLAIGRPQRDSVGATTHGQFSAGDYNITLWSYPEYYDNSSSVSTPYIDPKTAILLPEQPKFNLEFAAVPQLIDGKKSIQKGAYVFGDYPDERNATHDYDVKSAGIAIPVAVDQIYTIKTKA